MAHEGGCTCGKVRFRINAEPIIVHCCHCRQCQKHSGSAFILNLIVEAEALELLAGDPVEVTFEDTTHTTWFCGACGTYVYSLFTGRFAPFRFIRVGVMDEPDLFPPDVHIFTETRQPWVDLSGNIPSFPVTYEWDEFVPPESLARLHAAAQE